MRYGRSFYNPETSCFGYGDYIYKWWVQPSMSHNMVVVDGLQQEPTSCNQLLFHTGPMLQAVCVETEARWSNPPYMGGYDQMDACNLFGSTVSMILLINTPELHIDEQRNGCFLRSEGTE